MTNINKLRNVGISAHIDSGKTTLTERMLFYCGRIRKMGEVRGNDGGATMDSHSIEKRRGITIMSAVTHVDWKDHSINVIDTPGHVDFTVEVERSLRVLDGAVLVLCSVGGVQSQSLTVDRQMRRYGVPRIAFINKMDRMGANPDRVIEQMRDKLKTNAVAIQIPIGLGSDFEGVIDLINMEAIFFDGEHGVNVKRTEIPIGHQLEAETARKRMLESLALFDDSILEDLIAERVPSESTIRRVIRDATLAHQLTPVLIGSAYKNKGVQEVLDAINFYLPSPADRDMFAIDLSKSKEGLAENSPDDLADTEPKPKPKPKKEDTMKQVQLFHDNTKPFVAMAFKTTVTKHGQLTFVRVYQGQVEKGQLVLNVRTGKSVRFGRLVRLHANERKEIPIASAGDIVGVVGVDCASGDTFTSDKLRVALEAMYIAEPVMRLAISPADRKQAKVLAEALDRFRREDPTFQVQSIPETGETLIAGMGQLHLEVYLERIKKDYDCECIIGKPLVAYKERPSKSVEFSHKLSKQTGGPGQYAVITGRLDPIAENSDDSAEDFVFEQRIVGGRIDRKYIPAIRDGFAETLKNGPLGHFEVFGVKLTLDDGDMHDNDSSEYAFRLCAQQALREIVLPQADMKLWEPIMKVEVEVPATFQGAITGHLAKIRGIVTSSEVVDDRCVIGAEVPLAELFDYSNSIRSMTQGHATFSMVLHCYRQTPKQVQQAVLGEL